MFTRQPKTPAEQMKEGFDELTSKTRDITKTLDSLESQIRQFQSDIQAKQKELLQTGDNKGIIKLIDETIEFSEMKKKIRYIRYVNQVLERPNLSSVEQNLGIMKKELEEINGQIEKLINAKQTLTQKSLQIGENIIETTQKQRNEFINKALDELNMKSDKYNQMNVDELVVEILINSLSKSNLSIAKETLQLFPNLPPSIYYRSAIESSNFTDQDKLLFNDLLERSDKSISIQSNQGQLLRKQRALRVRQQRNT